MARSPQSFEKRQRERRKQMKRDEKFERRLIRNEEKRLAKQAEQEGKPWPPPEERFDELDQRERAERDDF